jgi:hypothetical protein
VESVGLAVDPNFVLVGIPVSSDFKDRLCLTVGRSLCFFAAIIRLVSNHEQTVNIKDLQNTKTKEEEHAVANAK